MVLTESDLIGNALRTLGDALRPHVDKAMTAARGEAWNDYLAEKDVREGRSRRKFPVSKSDPAVLLKVLIHERIAPWSRLDDYPRLRAYASEILSVRNSHSHGGSCTGEIMRLLDTSRRLLGILAAEVPDGLSLSSTQSSKLVLTSSPGALYGRENEVTIEDESLVPELTRLGERIRELDREFASQFESSVQSLGVSQSEFRSLMADGLDSDLKSAFIRELSELLSEDMRRIGPEIHDLVLETFTVERAAGDNDYKKISALAALVRLSMLSAPAVRQILENHLVRVEASTFEQAHREFEDALNAQDLEALDRALTDRERLDELFRADTVANYFHKGVVGQVREVILRAAALDEASYAAMQAITGAGGALATRIDEVADSDRDVAVDILRHAAQNARALATQESGSKHETFLIFILRAQGKLLNDLERYDEARHVFSRVSEIVDRYPTADPLIVAAQLLDSE